MPRPTARPAIYLFDGFPTVISFGTSDLQLYEKTVDPIGYSGGGPIDLVTMRNDALRTFSPKSLLTVTQSGVKSAYTPATLFGIASMMLVIQDISFTWPTGNSITFVGWVEDFKPEGLEEGKLPLADVKFEACNLDDAGNETAPSFT